jgi:hypothetical protein
MESMNPLTDRQSSSLRVKQLRHLASLEFDSLVPHLSAFQLTEVLTACVETVNDLIDEGRLKPTVRLNSRISEMEEILIALRELQQSKPASSQTPAGLN